jgi:glycosyltransferase involved in cell wall biosynthesis
LVNSKDLISVIIPAYNPCEILKTAVDSVLRQTLQEFELIVVDDGSTDGTSAWLDSQESIITVTQPNRGVSTARNAGIRKARGQWLAFLDSDDEWMPRKLERQMGYLENFPDCLICQTQEIWYRKGRRVNPGDKHEKPWGDIYTASLKLCLVTPSSVMMHKSLFDRFGMFDETFPACEDYDLWLRISSEIPVHLIDVPLLIRYGGRPDQLSASVEALDKYRVLSMFKMLKGGKLDREKRAATLTELQAKAKVYLDGCRKRDAEEEIKVFEDLLDQAEVMAKA